MYELIKISDLLRQLADGDTIHDVGVRLADASADIDENEDAHGIEAILWESLYAFADRLEDSQTSNAMIYMDGLEMEQ